MFSRVALSRGIPGLAPKCNGSSHSSCSCSLHRIDSGADGFLSELDGAAF